LALPRKSKLKEHRELRDDDGFLIRHFAGAVCYQTRHFIEKNNDALHASLEALVQECRNPFVQALFATEGDLSQQQQRQGKLNFISGLATPIFKCESLANTNGIFHCLLIS
jgi:myosin-6